MWVNTTRNKKNKFIGGYIERENKPFEAVIPEQIVKWMVLNQKSHVVLWYDSEMTTEAQVSHTNRFISQLIDKVNTDNPDLITREKFQMKDVREFEIVSNYPSAFSNKIPIYTRVNSLRLIAALEKEELDLEQRISSAFVYADYTMNPHSFEEVYEKGMPKDGFIGVNCDFSYCAGYENSFMIIGNQNIYTLGALRDMLVSTSKRIHLEYNNEIERKILNIETDRTGNLFFNTNDMWYESFIYGFTRQAIFIARVREMLQSGSLYFNSDTTDWKELWIFKNPSDYTFRTSDGYKIAIKDIKHEDPNLTDPKSYIAVIDDDRVTITRQSCHGDTGVR